LGEKRVARASIRRQPQQQRARQTVEAVLGATVKVLKRDGFDAITTNRIAEVAGVCIGSLYQYFPDKYAIYAALHQRHVQETRHLIEHTVSRHTTSSLEDLVCALTEALIDAHAGEPELHELLDRQIPLRAGGSQGLRGALRHVIASRTRELVLPRSLDQTLLVVPGMVDALAHEAVLSRPPHVSLASAREEAVRAISSYLRA
jgi:AcrR family transcriptional regulator